MTYTPDTSEIEGDRSAWCGECRKYQMHVRIAEEMRCEECCLGVSLPRSPLVTDDEVLGQAEIASSDLRLPAHYVLVPVVTTYGPET